MLAVHLVVDTLARWCGNESGPTSDAWQRRTTWIHDARREGGGVNHGTKIKKRWREPASG